MTLGTIGTIGAAPAPKLSPTPEQAAILAAARQTPDNLLISALAGTGKTSTLALLTKALPLVPILCLAFNKRIATEMAERLPGHVRCATLNALGHEAWGRSAGRKLTVSFNKTGDGLKAFIATFMKGSVAQRELNENFGAIIRAVGRAKALGVVPPRFEEDGTSGLIPWSEFIEDMDEDLDLPKDAGADVVEHLLIESIRQGHDGLIDFADQLYLPTIFGARWPIFPIVMVDEAQDLSALNHEMIRQLVRTVAHGPEARLIAVGDANQAIYGFRGALSNSMETLRQTFSMTEFPLSVTWRCPRAIVERARAHVPTYTAADSAPEGEVIDLSSEPPTQGDGDYSAFHAIWSPEGIPDNSAIICRNNAPLFSIALTLIRAGRGINLVGSDIGPQLLKILRNLGPTSTPQEKVHALIDQWETSRIRAKPKAEASTRDRADCLRVFADAGLTLQASIARAELVFASKGPIQLLSGHKSKGLEWETVYHVDPWRIPSRFAEPGTEAYVQELNVRYVIETRAKRRLVLVSAEDLTT